MRLQTTHSATVYGDRQDGTNAAGEPQIVTDAPVVTLQCRYRPQGSGLTRETGEPRIDRSPEIVVPTRGRHPDNGGQVIVSDTVKAGQRVDIQGVTNMYQITRVDPHFGHSGKPDRYTLELEAIGDD